jgi:hypothetical protein
MSNFLTFVNLLDAKALVLGLATFAGGILGVQYTYRDIRDIGFEPGHIALGCGSLVFVAFGVLLTVGPLIYALGWLG